MKDLDEKTLKLSDDLTLVSVEDSGAILDVEKRCYYDLNATAFFIASLLENGYPYKEIPAAITSEFSIDVETAQTDIDSYIEELQRHGLLGIGEETIEFNKAFDIKQGKRPYQAPAFEYQKELAVASAQVTTGSTD
ncbi:PqqD family protein [Chloroflexota bacterium]